MELLVQQFIDADIGRICLIEEVDDHNIELLAVAMAASNTLLNALRVPGHIVVDNQGAELEINTLSSCFRCNHNGCFVPEIVNDGCTAIGGEGSSHLRRAFVFLEPFVVDGRGLFVGVGAVEADQLTFVATFLQELVQEFLCAAGFGKDESLFGGSQLLQLVESFFQGDEQVFSFAILFDFSG